MRGETAWPLSAKHVPDFQIQTPRMWECWRTGDSPARGVQIPTALHRSGRAIRNPALVDAWKYGRGLHLERGCNGSDFHGQRIGTALCSISTASAELWTTGPTARESCAAARLRKPPDRRRQYRRSKAKLWPRRAGDSHHRARESWKGRSSAQCCKTRSQPT
jgi:hypothetical protein